MRSSRNHIKSASHPNPLPGVPRRGNWEGCSLTNITLLKITNRFAALAGAEGFVGDQVDVVRNDAD